MILARCIALVIGYVCGLFQTGYLYGRAHGIDIRTQGSGNAGTTNTLRTLGWKAGALTFLGDCFKAVLAVWIIRLIYQDTYADSIKLLELYAGFGAVLGHNFPCYLGFKGGKGIASTAGVVLAVAIPAAPICILMFLGIVLTTRYVSLGSICTMLTALIQVVIFNHMGFLDVAAVNAIEFDILMLCFTAMAIWRHRANIQRLLSGTENKFAMKGKGK